MALSQISKELKKLRIDHDINRAQMAKDLKIPERDLVLIEANKSPVSDEFLQQVAAKYAPEGSFENVLSILRDAVIQSVTEVVFDMTNMNFTQRQLVIALRNQIDSENRAATEAAEAEKKRLREERAANRAALKKEQKVAEVDQPFEEAKVAVKPEEQAIASNPKSQAVDDGLTDEDLEVLAALEAA